MLDGRLVLLLGLPRQQEAGKLKIHTSQTPVAKVSGDLALHIHHVSSSCKLDAYTSVLQAYSRPVFSGQPSDMPESPCFGLLPFYHPQESSSWNACAFQIQAIYSELTSPPPHPRARYQQPGIAACPRASPKLAHPASPVPSSRKPQ